MRLTLLLLAAIGCAPSLGCAQVQPVPTPPVPTDEFTKKVFNCHLEIVGVERDTAMPDVHRCLLVGTTDHCLSTMAVQYQLDTIACVARDLGSRANAAVLAGSTDPNDELMAAQARGWISSHQAGYR
jgi:hypothetical protein